MLTVRRVQPASTEHRRPWQRTIGRGAIGPICLALACSLASPLAADDCPDGDERAVRVTVTVELDPPRLSVDRPSITIFHEPEGDQPRRACWVAVGLPSTARLLLEPKNPGALDPFPVLIRRMAAGRSFANSGNPTHPTTWAYGLRLVDADGETLTFLDPEVIVKGRGG